MCVVAIAWKAHPQWHLVMAGNRDEFHARPSAPLQAWHDKPRILAGRDMQSGGTWAGVSTSGRLAVVTNLRGFGDPQPERASRGALVADYLDGNHVRTSDLNAYNPFNLFVAHGHEAHFLSNRPRTISRSLSPGVHSLSNGTAEEPWPRREQLDTDLRTWLLHGRERADLLAILMGETQFPDGPPIFIRSPVYGTRCSTVIAIEADGQGQITERRYLESGEIESETTLNFNWPI